MNTWDEFLRKESKRLNKGSRSYLHFDYSRNILRNTDFYKNYLTNTKNIESHSFKPFLKVIIETPRFKKNDKGVRKLSKKKRPILYASHFDSLIYSYYGSELLLAYEKLLESIDIRDSVLAYRKIDKKSNIEFAYDAFRNILDKGECIVVALDVKSFFDNISHKVLKAKWQQALNVERLPNHHYKVYKSLTKYSYVDKQEALNILSISNNKRKKIRRICNEKVFRNIIRGLNLIRKNIENYGIPQGSPMSGLLSNIAMIDFDIYANKLAKNCGGTYYRYSDDLLFILNKDSNITEFKDNISAFLEDQKGLGLTLNEGKEEIVKFEKKEEDLVSFKYQSKERRNLQYLGFEFTGSKVLIRSSSMSRYHTKLNKGVFNTVKRALGKGSNESLVRRSKLYKRYTHVGNSNFISYAYRSANIFEDIDGETIRSQVSGHINKLEKTIKKKVTFRKRKLKRKKAYINNKK